jgi:CCR4-Not complex component, Not1
MGAFGDLVSTFGQKLSEVPGPIGSLTSCAFSPDNSIELIKNQRYNFWGYPFTRCASEIEKVFESVARSCMPPGAQRATLVGGDD